jgi:hypothetical protein
MSSASSLSLLVQLTGNPTSEQTQKLRSLFTPANSGQPSAGTDILHYAWLTIMPSSLGGPYAFLSTVYDLDFYDYVKVLVTADPAAFDSFLPFLVGGSEYVPVMQHLDAFINVFVKGHDLAQNPQGSPNGFVPDNPKNPGNPKLFQGYFWTVGYILNQLGPGQP